jgi:protein-tyrosine kinase
MEHILTAMRKSGASSEAAPFSENGGPGGRTTRDAMWSGLQTATVQPGHLEANRIVTLNRWDSAHGAFDLLRTRVLQEMRQHGWTSVAITSATRGAGKSVVALNLAYSLANCEDCRTVLLDLDLRSPRIGKLLGTGPVGPIESFLTGRIDVEEAFQRFRPNLAIATNGHPVRLAAELLQSSRTAKALRDLKRKLMPDILVCDLPPMLASDDLVAFLPNVDCAILVVEADKNTPDEVDRCERELSLQTNMLGVVLNKCRHGDGTSYGSGG